MSQRGPDSGLLPRPGYWCKWELSLNVIETTDKVQYHDDGEGWLGPTIVTFSLGSNATMTIRMKGKYYLGATGNNLKTYDPNQEIVEGCVAPEYREYMNENWSSWTSKKQTTEFGILKSMRPGNSLSPPVVFKTTLAHGDYIVMHGDDLQKYYEVRDLLP